MMNKQYDELIEQLRLLDNDFMYLVFRDDQECVELLLFILFQKHIPIEYYYVEHQIINTNGRSVILDLLVKSKDHIINVEIQRDDAGADLKRARYHQSMVDVYESYANEKWQDMEKITTAFICEKDYFKEGKAIYHSEKVIKETRQRISDNAEYIYINGEYEGEDAIGWLMHDFRERDYRKMHYEVLRKKVRYLKESKGGRKKMCKIFEDLKEQGRQEERQKMIKTFEDLKEQGRQEERRKMSKTFEDLKEQGRQEGRQEERQNTLSESIWSLMKQLQITEERAMQLLGVCQDENGIYKRNAVNA